MWRKLKAAKWGEIALWVGFVVLGLSGLESGSDTITFAGLCALSAIGVRATRHEIGSNDRP